MCVCVMGGRILIGFGHFALCKCAGLGVNECVDVQLVAGF